MIRLQAFLISLVAILSVTISSAKAAPITALQAFSGGNLSTSASDQLYGWEFQVLSTVNVTALGVGDTDSDGLEISHDVGIFRSSDMALLTSTTIPAGSGATLDAGFRYVSLGSSQTLTPDTYVIAMTMPTLNGDTQSLDNTSFATAPELLYLTSRFDGGSTLAFPTIADAFAEGMFGPNFQFDQVDAQSVPEPSTFVLALLGLGVGVCVWRRRRRAISLVALVILSGAATGLPAARGDLFVAAFAGGGVSRFDGSGNLIYANGQGNAIHMAFGTDGLAYVTTLFDSSVVKVDPSNGNVLATFVPSGSGGLSTSVGITLGPDGNLYVGSRDTGEVLRYNGLTGAFIDSFTTGSPLNSTEHLLFGPDGNLYATEFSGDRVLQFDGTLGTFNAVFATDPSLSGARMTAFGPDGNLYVTGNFSDNVVRFDGATGVFIDEFITDVNGANGLAFGTDSYLYVAAEFDGAIYRYSASNGAFVDTFASVTNPIGIVLAEVAESVPEPTALPLAALGLLGLGCVALRK